MESSQYILNGKNMEKVMIAKFQRKDFEKIHTIYQQWSAHWILWFQVCKLGEGKECNAQLLVVSVGNKRYIHTSPKIICNDTTLRKHVLVGLISPMGCSALIGMLLAPLQPINFLQYTHYTTHRPYLCSCALGWRGSWMWE